MKYCISSYLIAKYVPVGIENGLSKLDCFLGKGRKEILPGIPKGQASQRSRQGYC